MEYKSLFESDAATWPFVVASKLTSKANLVKSILPLIVVLQRNDGHRVETAEILDALMDHAEATISHEGGPCRESAIAIADAMLASSGVLSKDLFHAKRLSAVSKAVDLSFTNSDFVRCIWAMSALRYTSFPFQVLAGLQGLAKQLEKQKLVDVLPIMFGDSEIETVQVLMFNFSV
jgi:hypothetical protein